MKCYLCNNEQHDLVTEKLRYGSPIGANAYKCKNCGLYFLYPQMTPEQERIFYEKEYGEIFSDEKGTTPAQLFQKRQGDANMYYEWCKDYISKDQDCLEIGSASGYFLAKIKDKVKSVTGIETHKLLREYANKIGIYTVSSLDECRNKQYDSIFMFFLLEHLGDPIGYLKNLKHLLKPKGSIFIVVPNVDDILISTYEIKGLYEFYFTPAHQFYYSPQVLSTIFEKADFSSYKLNFFQRYDLSNHMHWMMAGKPGGQGKYNHIFSKDLLKKYADDLIKQRKCDTIFAVVKKTSK